MLSKVVILTFVIVIVGIVTRVILLPLSQFVLLFFYTFNIVLGMPPVPHAVQVAQLKALHLSKVDLRQ